MKFKTLAKDNFRLLMLWSSNAWLSIFLDSGVGLIAILAKVACIIATDTYFFKSDVSVINALALRCFRQNLGFPLSPVCFLQMEWIVSRIDVRYYRLTLLSVYRRTANEMNNQLKCKFRRSICDSEVLDNLSSLEARKWYPPGYM